MDDTILEGLSPSTNATVDAHSNKNIIEKNKNNEEWEVPAVYNNI